MPIYTFECRDCGQSGTKIVSIKDRDAQLCEECLTPLVRKIDRPGLVWAPTAGGMR